MSANATAARFRLYVKAGKDGNCVGDCPFSQRASMYARMKLKPADVEIIPVNTVDKPEYFMKINPEGKVPVLIDGENGNKIIPDSTEITKYINGLFPTPDVRQSYDGPAVEAASGIFQKFAALMKNKDSEKENELKDALVAELKKLNDYLQGRNEPSSYLVCNKVCELDCQVLPKLKHVQVAGGHYKNFKIPDEFSDLRSYIQCGESSDVFKATCPADDQIIWGWSKFF